MNPALLFLLFAAAKGAGAGGKSDQAVNAYKIDNWGIMVIDLGTGGLSLVLADKINVGFVTDGTRVVTVRYGTMANALVTLPRLNDGSARSPLDAKFWAGPNAVVIKGAHISTIVFDADNIATVETGHFLGKCLQGTQASCSALISKILAAGINLDAAPAVVGRGGGYTLHHGRIPAHSHKWREVLQFLDR